MAERQKADVSRPAILYAEQVDTQPDIDAYLETRRLSVIDIEMDTVMAEQILAHLKERLASRHAVGSIRLRFTGRLIHL
jgi:hypothetical protein